MNIADVQRLTQALVEKYEGSSLPVTVSHTSSGKGLTYTLKAKRIKPAFEITSKRPAGYHTFTVGVTYDEVMSLIMTRRVVDEDSGELQVIEVDASPETLVDVVTAFEQWHALVGSIEAASKRSLRDQPKMPTQRKKPKEETEQVTSSRRPVSTPPATTPTEPVATTKQSTSSSSVHKDDPRAKNLDTKHYIVMGDWFVRKVLGEYTAEELDALWPPTDPLLARTVEARGRALPPLGGPTPARDVTPVVPFSTTAILMRLRHGGMLRVNACRGPEIT